MKKAAGRFLLSALCVVLSSPLCFADRWILDSPSNRLPGNLVRQVQDAGGQLLDSWDFLGIALAEFPDEPAARSLEGAGFRVMPDVRISLPPQAPPLELAGIEDDESYYRYQWHLPLIQADLAWNEGYTGEGVRVAVLDSGIYYPHPDLFDNIDHASSISFVGGSTDYIDDNGHGTGVAGIIAAADNGWGTIGIAPHATLIAVKIVGTGADSHGTASRLIQGIIHAVQHDADIINMSLQGEMERGRDSALLLATLSKLFNWAASQGVLVVCAAGNKAINFNHSRNVVFIPGEVGNGLVVSAVGPTDLPAYYTNHGTSLVWVAAPGGDRSFGTPGQIFKPYITPPGWPGFYFIRGEGTSYAAPMVCGVAALILETYGRMDVGRLKNILANTADDLGKPGVDDFYGRGRINAYRAVTRK